MKKVKIVTAIASTEPLWPKGPSYFAPKDEVAVPVALADAWIASGVAKPAEDDPADLRKQMAELRARLDVVEPKK